MIPVSFPSTTFLFWRNYGLEPDMWEVFGCFPIVRYADRKSDNSVAMVLQELCPVAKFSGVLIDAGERESSGTWLGPLVHTTDPSSRLSACSLSKSCSFVCLSQRLKILTFVSLPLCPSDWWIHFVSTANRYRCIYLLAPYQSSVFDENLSTVPVSLLFSGEALYS